MKKADFDEKLKNFNNNVTSNKSKHKEVGKKLNDHLTSSTELINDISKEVKLISTKGLRKHLINEYSIFMVQNVIILYFNHYTNILQHQQMKLLFQDGNPKDFQKNN